MNRWKTAVLLGLLSVCGSCAASHDVSSSSQTLAAPIELSAACLREIEESIDGLPDRLDCTGLYSSMASKTMANEVKEFKPAVPLWSDGSVKTRWVYLPKGTTIDASNPDSWKFPKGTRFWKEFRNPDGSRRIETRIFLKNDENDWSRTTYVWDAEEKQAMRLDGGRDIDVDGSTYRIPSGEQCNECHNGRRDRVLGFDQVMLGLAGTGNITLADLVAENRLKGFSGPTNYNIGPDPKTDEALALGWMHSNCGVSCHNNNSNSKAFSNGMRLYLKPSELDGRDPKQFESVTTTVGLDVFALQWRGKKRIVPGNPDESWLLSLINARGNPKEQMPPVASNQKDPEYTEIIRRWIEGMPKPEGEAPETEEGAEE